MNLEALAASSIDGLMLGFIYGLAAMGLTLIFGVMHIVNFAPGEMVDMLRRTFDRAMTQGGAAAACKAGGGVSRITGQPPGLKPKRNWTESRRRKPAERRPDSPAARSRR